MNDEEQQQNCNINLKSIITPKVLIYIIVSYDIFVTIIAIDQLMHRQNVGLWLIELLLFNAYTVSLIFYDKMKVCSIVALFY